MDPCGTAMDLKRSCYETVIRPFRDSDEAYPIIWFWCAPDAKVFPAHHRFSSIDWDHKEREVDPPLVGEVRGAPRPWRGGAPPALHGFRGDHFCGPLEWFQDGVPHARRAMLADCSCARRCPNVDGIAPAVVTLTVIAVADRDCTDCGALNQVYQLEILPLEVDADPAHDECYWRFPSEEDQFFDFCGLKCHWEGYWNSLTRPNRWELILLGDDGIGGLTLLEEHWTGQPGQFLGDVMLDLTISTDTYCVYPAQITLNVPTP